MKQVKEAVTIAEIKYPSENYNLVFCLIKAVDTQLTMMMHLLCLV